MQDPNDTSLVILLLMHFIDSMYISFELYIPKNQNTIIKHLKFS